MSDNEATKLSSSERRESEQAERKDAAATQREGGLSPRSGGDGSAVKVAQEQRPELTKPQTAGAKADAPGDGKAEALAANKAEVAGKQSVLGGVEGNPRLAQLGEKVLGQGVQEAATVLDSAKAKLSETAQGLKQAVADGLGIAAQKAEAAKQAVADKAEAAKQAVSEKAEQDKTGMAEKAEAAKQAVTEKAEAAKQAVTEKVEAAKQTVSEGFDAAERKAEAAKQAVTEKADAAKSGAAEKVEAGKRVVSEGLDSAERKAEAAKQAVTEKAEAAKQTYEDVKQKAIQTDHQLYNDKRYTALMQVLESVPVGDPAVFQISKSVIGQLDKSAEGARAVSDVLSDDPGRRAAGKAVMEQRLQEIYADTYPAGIEAMTTFAGEKMKGQSNESAAITAAEHALKYVPFAKAEEHFEKAADAYRGGDNFGAAVHVAAGVQSFGTDAVNLASAVDMGVSGAEFMAGRGAAEAGAVRAPVERAPKVETPAPKVETPAPKVEVPAQPGTAGAPAEAAGVEAPKTQPGAGQPPVEIVPDQITPEELRKVTVPPETPVPDTVRQPGVGQPPVEIVPDQITPEELRKVTVPAEGQPAGEQPQSTARSAEQTATARQGRIDTDGGAREPEPARDPSTRDLPAGGGMPGLDTGGKPFPQQTITRTRGEPSAPEDLTGTDRRTGTAFNERNPAEIVNNLRVEYDASAGRPVRVSYDVDANTVSQDAASGRSFARDRSTEGAQGTNSAYAGSGYDRGHLAQREAFKGSRETERSADLHTNVVPMAKDLNRGPGSPWREAETATTELAKEKGTVRVEVEVHYGEPPPTLRDGTPIPDSFDRRVIGTDGEMLRNDHFNNRIAR